MTATPASPSYLDALPHGVYAIDTGFHRPRFDAAYLLVERGRAAFLDTGPNLAVPRLLAALDALGLERDAVDWVIPSHVHLDHAGGAGLLMQSLPKARLVVHPRGARHMIDPSALCDGALAVYGEAEMQRSYGRLVPVPAERVLTSGDGFELALAGRSLHFIDAPGHARHHHAVWDERSRGWFTGDAFGLSYPEFEVGGRAWILPTTTPVQFEPEPLKATVRRLLSFEPECMYLTHFGRLGDVARLGEALLARIDQVVAVARSCAGGGGRHAALRAGLTQMYLERLREHGSDVPQARALEILELDIEANAQGLAIWLDRG